MINTFASPIYLWLLFLIPAFIWWDYVKKDKPSLYFSDIETVKKSMSANYQWIDIAITALKVLALIFLIIALARPQLKTTQHELFHKGVDMMIALDASGSMAAEDLEVNRLTSAKKIIKDFVARRPNDRMGLVVFGVNAITKSPLTFDRNMLLNVIEKVRLGEAGDATAIGQALVTCLNRIRESEAKTKIIILVTDGESNTGSIGPLEAAQLAADIGIKIYTIGIGTVEGTPIVVYDPRYGKVYPRNPDGSYALTKLNITDLVKIAEKTNGRFYQAKNTRDLIQIFATIDKLEKVELKSDTYSQFAEQFEIFLLLGLLCVLAELYLGYVVVRTTPCI